jgi:hypothetical protein
LPYLAHTTASLTLVEVGTGHLVTDRLLVLGLGDVLTGVLSAGAASAEGAGQLAEIRLRLLLQCVVYPEPHRWMDLEVLQGIG